MLINYNYEKSYVLFASVNFNSANNILDAHLIYFSPNYLVCTMRSKTSHFDYVCSVVLYPRVFSLNIKSLKIMLP